MKYQEKIPWQLTIFVSCDYIIYANENLKKITRRKQVRRYYYFQT